MINGHCRQNQPRHVVLPFIIGQPEIVQLAVLADSAFAYQFWQTNGGRPLPLANGTNRSQLRCPGRSFFNSTWLNKAVECFRSASDEQTQLVQSLEDILQKIVLKCDVRKSLGTSAINARGAGYEARVVHTSVRSLS